MADNIYSAYHYSCKTKADREAIEALKPQIDEVASRAVFGNIGDIKYTARTEEPNGCVWCNGKQFAKADFETVYQMLVDGKLQAVTMDVYDSTVSTNKSCGFFGLDTVNEVFKVPTLTDVYLKAGQAAQTFGAESLPQHTHTGTVALQGTFDNYNTGYYNQFAGADYSSGRGTGTLKTGGASSGVYKDNAKVNPDHVKYRACVVLYTTEKEASIINWTNQLNTLTEQLKKDLVSYGSTTITYWD